MPVPMSQFPSRSDRGRGFLLAQPIRSAPRRRHSVSP